MRRSLCSTGWRLPRFGSALFFEAPDSTFWCSCKHCQNPITDFLFTFCCVAMCTAYEAAGSSTQPQDALGPYFPHTSANLYGNLATCGTPVIVQQLARYLLLALEGL